jgi:hypothetical protein
LNFLAIVEMVLEKFRVSSFEFQKRLRDTAKQRLCLTSVPGLKPYVIVVLDAGLKPRSSTAPLRGEGGTAKAAP